MADDNGPSLEGLIGSRARDENGRFITVTPTEEPPVNKTDGANNTAFGYNVGTTLAATKAAPEPAKASESVVTTTPATAVAPVVAQPTQPTENAEAAAYKKAMREEREKRQAAEARLRELQTPKTPVDPWQDLPGTLSQQEQKFEERLFVERCNTTEELARDRHKDFDEVREVFLEAAQNNPNLFQQLRQERNPAEFAYREGLKIKRLGAFNGDFSAYEKDIETRTEARVRAELEAKYGKQPETPVPTSLNSDSSPAQQTAVYAGPPPLKSILRIADKANARR